MSSSQSNAAPWVVGLADDDDGAFHRTSSVSLTPFGLLEWHPGTLSCTSFHSWPLCVGHTHILACHSQPSSPHHPPPYLCAGRLLGREQVGLAVGPVLLCKLITVQVSGFWPWLPTNKQTEIIIYRIALTWKRNYQINEAQIKKRFHPVSLLKLFLRPPIKKKNLNIAKLQFTWCAAISW